MAYKNTFLRLAYSFLENSGLGRRNFSSISTKYGVRGVSPMVNNLPSFTSQYIRGNQPKPDMIDPGFMKTPFGILDMPVPFITNRITDIPVITHVPTIRPTKPVAVEDPTEVVEQQAARLIVIRRRKMRRHKLRKLRKKMKFVYAKRRQRRELKKEKEFQAELMGRIKEAEKFSAAAYVAAKIEKANEVSIPKTWRGKRLPEFVIRDLLEKRSKKIQARLEKYERRSKMVQKVADYKV